MKCRIVFAVLFSLGFAAAAPANLGDVDDNGVVDVFDIIAALADKAGTYNTRSDSNNDGQINVFDLVLIARYYGTNYASQGQPIFSDDFESGGLSAAVGGTWYAITNMNVVTDNPRSGAYSLRSRYLTTGALSEIRGWFPASDEIWMEWYVYIPANYVRSTTSPSNNKWWATGWSNKSLNPATDGLHGTYCTYPGQWSVRLETYPGQVAGSLDRSRITYANRVNCALHEWSGNPWTADHGPPMEQFDSMYATADVGSWVQWRVHVKKSSVPWTVQDPDPNYYPPADAMKNGGPSGSFTTALHTGDGEVHIWKNGVLVSHADLLPLSDGSIPGTPMDVFEIMGATNAKYAQQTDFYIDDVKVYSQDPSWGGPAPTCTNGQTRQCAGSSIGVCTPGMETCVNGNWDGICAGQVLPSVEACSDTVDNDCNGQTDEGCATGGGQALFSDDFESGDLSKTENGASWDGSAYTSVTNQNARSGNYALKYAFTGGPNCTSDSFAEQRFDLGRNIDEFWAEWYIYYPDGTEPYGGASYVHREQYAPVCPLGQGLTATNNKFIRVWGDTYNHGAKVGASTWAAGFTGDSNAGPEYGPNEQPLGPAGLPNYGPWVDSKRGQWIQVRWHSTFATNATNNDGVIQMWRDGTLIVDHANLDIWSAVNYWNQGYLLGHANSGFDQDTYIFIDDVKFYDQDPEWSSTSSVGSFTPNEPAGMTMLDEVDFSQGGHLTRTVTAGTQSNYDGSALLPPYSPNSVARFVYPAGFQAGMVGERALVLPDNTVRVYATYNWYLSPGFALHTSDVKQWYLFFDQVETQGSIVVGMSPSPPYSPLTTVSPRLNVKQHTQPSGTLFDTHADNDASISPPVLQRGQWYHVEWLATMNTPSNADGAFQLWIDGDRILSFDNVQYQGTPATQWKKLKLFPFYGGGAIASVPQEQYEYVDHAYVSTSTTR